MYYSYHNVIKRRIKTGELIGYRKENNRPRIGECMVLEFARPPFEYPIRPSRYAEYMPILKKWERRECNG